MDEITATDDLEIRFETNSSLAVRHGNNTYDYRSNYRVDSCNTRIDVNDFSIRSNGPPWKSTLITSLEHVFFFFMSVDRVIVSQDSHRCSSVFIRATSERPRCESSRYRLRKRMHVEARTTSAKIDTRPAIVKPRSLVVLERSSL